MSTFPDTPLEARAPTGLDVERILGRLVREFPHVDEGEIRTFVAETAAGYRDVRVVQYVGIFVERETRDRLRRASLPRPRVGGANPLET